MHREAITACIAKISELMKRLGAGTPRPVADVLDDYDEFRHQVSLLDEAGVLEKKPYQDTRRIIRTFIDQFDTNIEAIVTTRYSTARRAFDEAKTAETKRRVLSQASAELDRLARYPEHQDHSLLKGVLNALREWEAKLGVGPRT